MESMLSPQKIIDEVKNKFDFLKDSDLFDNTSEISVAYLMAYLLKENTFLSHYSIDIEYNQIAKNLIHPVLIVHLPKTQLANLLVIEFTKSEDVTREQPKLVEMTKRDGEYRYRLGILVNVSKEPKENYWEYFVDG